MKGFGLKKQGLGFTPVANFTKPFQLKLVKLKKISKLG